MSRLGRILALLVAVFALGATGTGVASAAPANNQVVASATSVQALAMASSCQTKSYNYTDYDFPFDWWRVANKCKTLHDYNQIKNSDSANYLADTLCGGLATLFGPAGFIVGPLCIADFRADHKQIKANLHYAATHTGKCIAYRVRWDGYPWNSTKVKSCHYH